MKTLNIVLSALLLSAGAASCSDSKFGPEPPLPEQNPGGEQPGQEDPGLSSRNEQYRPQIHYTPARNWINDPNGMFYLDGVWHFYYQYNPMGKLWGNLSWGHAVSTDLVHWTEKNVVLTPNENGMIFSGSCVIDRNNTAGFGKDAIIAMYTSTDPCQQESIAYSTDGGETFKNYDGNPVLLNPEFKELRDPKVFWDEKSNQWVCSLATGWAESIEFWGSPDMKNWTKLSEFRSDSRRSNIGQWECPDLFKMDYNGSEKWVLIVSNNPGGPCGGSGIEYFIGQWNGKEFTADALDYPLWLDYGADNYAGVTWYNAPSNRRVMIGWMNNWDYANEVPVSPWTSANTLPRELKLVSLNGSPVLSSLPVKEVEGISGDWQKANDGNLGSGDAFEVRFNVSLTENTTFRLENGAGQYLEVEVNAAAGSVIAKRTGTTGEVAFNSRFSRPSVTAPFNCPEPDMTLHIFLDRSSVEIFNESGTLNMTNLVFPVSTYNKVTGVDNVEYRKLESIW